MNVPVTVLLHNFVKEGEGQECTFPINCHIFSCIKENESSLLGKFLFSRATPLFSTRDKNCGQGLWTGDSVWHNSQCALIIKKGQRRRKGEHYLKIISGSVKVMLGWNCCKQFGERETKQKKWYNNVVKSRPLYTFKTGHFKPLIGRKSWQIVQTTNEKCTCKACKT